MRWSVKIVLSGSAIACLIPLTSTWGASTHQVESSCLGERQTEIVPPDPTDSVSDADALALAEALDGYQPHTIGSYIGSAESGPQDVTVVLDAEADSAAVEVAIQDADIMVPVEIKVSCRTLPELRAARSQIPDLVARAPSLGPVVHHIDPETETVSIVVNDESDAAAFANELGDLATIRVGWVARLVGSRTQDAAPHNGGARIENQRTGGACTSSFKVRRTETDVPGMLTAGHCGLEGDRFRSGPDGDPDYFFGEVSIRAPFPAYDVMFMRDSNYVSRVYANPGTPYRDVVEDRNAVELETVCFSGFRSLEECNVIVVDTSACYTDAAGTTCHASFGNKGSQIGFARPGDSGAPVYSKRSGSGDAVIHGVVFAGIDPDPDNGAFRVGYWQNIAAIKGQLNVTVVTGG